MEIRPYTLADREACLAILDSNRPLADRDVFQTFLAAPEGPYFVMEHDGAVIGCGGYVPGPGSGLASLVWGMIRRDLQRQGLGRFLLMYRLREIGKAGDIALVRVTTPQDFAGFFQGQGFRAGDVRNGRVEMAKKLAVCA